jgi:cytochrome c553
MAMKKTLLFVLIASLGQFAYAGGNAGAGAEKSKACAACHGADGNKPISPDIPRLAGQHADYLTHALSDYKSGARKDAVMSGQAAALSPRDIQDIAAYFHGQSGDLKIIPLHRLAGGSR